MKEVADCPLGCKFHPDWLDAPEEASKVIGFRDGYLGCPIHDYEAHEAAYAPDGLVTPYKSEITEPGWAFCHYRCSVHGQEWTMGWAVTMFQDTELAVYV